MDPVTIAAALGPLALEIFRSLKEKFLPSDGFKAANMAEWLEMKRIELQQFQAMQDQPIGVLWIDAFDKLKKPAFATIVLLIWGYQETFFPTGARDNVVNFAAAVGFWMFGEMGKSAFLQNRAKPKGE